MRDGMNLVCKEFLASKLDGEGVLILSEMAGASKELNEAILINPNDKHQVADAIRDAIEMPVDEQVKNMESMQKTIKRYNIHHWVDLFLTRLEVVKKKQAELSTKILDKDSISGIVQEFKKSKSRILFLDYDGTLMNFSSSPEKAFPDKDLLTLLNDLSCLDNLRVVIITGRDRHSISGWLSEIPVDIIAEHGVWLKERGGDWSMIENLDFGWKDEIRPILEMYVSKTPGSLVEEKDFSLVWHYRKVETGLGELRAREIVSHLKFLASSMNLQVLEGVKVVEIKNTEVNKGRAATKWLSRHKSDFITTIGDDWTDEDMFEAMPERAYTIKVGSTSSSARYSLETVESVREFLEQLIN